MASTGSLTTTLQASNSPAAAEKSLVLKATKEPIEKFRLDYRPTEFLIEHVDLDFWLHPSETRVCLSRFSDKFCGAETEISGYEDLRLSAVSAQVSAELRMRRRSGTPPCDLVLDGEQLSLRGVWVNDEPLGEGLGKGGYVEETKGGSLRVFKEALPAEADAVFRLKTQVVINPQENLKLSGLYRSGGLFVTQCEAEGFRRITYFLDRPDVMSLYRVSLP